jgi:hypothetical protein
MHERALYIVPSPSPCPLPLAGERVSNGFLSEGEGDIVLPSPPRERGT